MLLTPTYTWSLKGLLKPFITNDNHLQSSTTICLHCLTMFNHLKTMYNHLNTIYNHLEQIYN